MSVLSVCSFAHSASKGSDGIDRQPGQPSVDWVSREGGAGKPLYNPIVSYKSFNILSSLDGASGVGGDESGKTPNGLSDAVQALILKYSSQLQKVSHTRGPL